ncbi:hypothetical protein [Rhodococcus koreensis]
MTAKIVPNYCTTHGEGLARVEIAAPRATAVSPSHAPPSAVPGEAA